MKKKTDDKMQEAMVEWFRQQPKELFADGIGTPLPW